MQWLVVHQTVDLTDPLDQFLDASNAVAPLGCPLGQEDCHMYWITVSRHCTLGNCSGKLEVFVKKDWFKFFDVLKTSMQRTLRREMHSAHF